MLVNDLALVTGGAHGLGAAIAGELAAQGARVIVGDVDLPAAQETARKIGTQGGNAVAIVLDVSDNESIRRAQDEITSTYGDLSILINNAGISLVASVDDPNAIANWNSIIQVNLNGVFYVTSAFLEPLKRTRGRIVNLCSVTAFTSGRSNTAYVASKGGVRSLTQMLARQLADYGIRVNAVAPGYIETRMVGELMAEDPEAKAWVEWHTPMKRLGKPSEIAGPVAFLVSAAASFVNGVTLPVDGGYLVM